MVHLAPSHLEQPDVVVALGVVVVDAEGQPEALVGEVDIPDAKGHVAQVVPDLKAVLMKL